MPRRKTNEEFITEAALIWGNQFDYSKVKYVNGRTEVIILCKKHNKYFKQSPFVHIVSKHNGCPICQQETQRIVSQRRRLSFDEFQKRCYEKFGNSIDVSMSIYEGMDKTITAICTKGHGPFRTTPSLLLNSKYGCNKCSIVNRANSFKITKEQFLSRAYGMFGNSFIYDKTVYRGYLEPIEIECSKHGVFTVTPKSHLRNEHGGCPDCHSEHMQHVNSSMTPEEYIKKAKDVWGEIYDYSETDFHSYKKMISIRCLKHDILFSLLPQSHLNGRGCPSCEQEEQLEFEIRKQMLLDMRKEVWINIKRKKERSKEVLKNRPSKNGWNVDEFIKLAILIHGDDYDYINVRKEYVNQNTPVNIICNKHKTAFLQTPDKHLYGQGCPRCIGRHQTSESFIEEAKYLYQDKYDYSLVEYKGCSKPVLIKCKKHGIFSQIPVKHLRGEGCSQCAVSILESNLLLSLAKNYSGLVISQKQFDWLKTTRTMPIDIYLPSLKLAIECQGLQHFMPKESFGGEEGFRVQIERDRIKNQLCQEHGIDVWYYTSSTYKVPQTYLGPVFTKIEVLLTAIEERQKVIEIEGNSE